MRLTVNRRPILIFLASAAAAFGAVALAVVLVRKIRVALAGEVLLTQERASYTVRLEQRIPVTHNVRLFRFALKSPQQRLGFRVGEHVLLYARIGDRTVMRPYTPVSRTDHRGSFDIMVKIYPAGVSRKHPNGGLMSQYLDNLQPGDKIEIQGPKGRFVYEGRGLFATADGRRLPLVTRLGLVAAGSGVTPMLQLLRHLLADGIDQTSVMMIDVNHSEEDIIARQELDEYAKNHGGFREQHREPWVARWLPAVGRRHYGLFLAVVSVTSLASATLLAFATMTHQEAQLRGFDNEGGKGVGEGQDESMAVIRKAFEENSMDEQNAPMKPSASSSVNLLCRFSVRYRVGIYPYGVCTHFIYASVPNSARPNDEDVLYSYDKDAFKKFLHVRDLAPDARLLLSVELEAMLNTGWPAQRLASDARVWLGRSGVDGLHVAGLDLLPRNVPNITDIVTALRKSFKRQYLLTIGIDRTQSTVEKDLLKILKLADFASFKTCHLRHTDDYTTLTNPYSKYDNSTSGEFLGNEVNKLAKLAARSPKSRLCFTLTLAGNQFLLRDSEHHGLGAPAKHVRDASYSEICRRKWSEVRYVESAMGFYARSGRTWIGYDTEKTVAGKVQLALRRHPKFCVMLMQVDKDDFRGICSEKHFPLAQSVRHAMRLYGGKMPGSETS